MEIADNRGQVHEILEIAVVHVAIEVLHDPVFVDDLVDDTNAVFADWLHYALHEVLMQCFLLGVARG